MEENELYRTFNQLKVELIEKLELIYSRNEIDALEKSDVKKELLNIMDLMSLTISAASILADMLQVNIKSEIEDTAETISNTEFTNNVDEEELEAMEDTCNSSLASIGKGQAVVFIKDEMDIEEHKVDLELPDLPLDFDLLEENELQVEPTERNKTCLENKDLEKLNRSSAQIRRPRKVAVSKGVVKDKGNNLSAARSSRLEHLTVQTSSGLSVSSRSAIQCKCGKVMMSTHGYTQHRRKCKKGDKVNSVIFECDLCATPLSSKRGLKIHRGSFKCKIRARKIELLTEDIEVPTEAELAVDDTSNVTQPSSDHPLERHVCECGRIASTHVGLKNHQRWCKRNSADEGNASKCPSLSETLPNNMQYRCDVCDKVFPSIAGRSLHFYKAHK